MRTGLHQAKFFFAEEIAIPNFAIHVKSDNVSLLEHFLKRATLGVAARQDIGYVIEDDAHAGGLCEIGELGADAAVPHDTQSHAAHFMAAACRFIPAACVHLRTGGEDAADQHDDFT